MKNVYFLLTFLVIAGIILSSVIIPINAQDIAQLMSEKYSIKIDEHVFDLYYGFKGSLEVDIPSLDFENPSVSHMLLSKEKKSLELYFEQHEYAGAMWVRFPTELISAKGGEFQLFIDGVNKPYELTYYGENIAIGFIIPEGAQKVEIVGTSVIPEFSNISVLVLGTGMISLAILTRKIIYNTNYGLK